MQAFQNIADAIPGADGHPSRNSGEPGYLASALYVKDKMEAAGYDVKLQKYKFTYTSYDGTPSWSEVSPTARSFAVGTDWNPGASHGTATGSDGSERRRHRDPADPEPELGERLQRRRLQRVHARQHRA